MKTSISVLIPVYNERHLVVASLSRLKILDSCEHLERIEAIVVNDCSKDGTDKILETFAREVSQATGSRIEWIFLSHDRNKGKGQAVKTALDRATCEISVIHDADLEYHPRDLLRIVDVFIEDKADAVFGSRFAGERRRVLLYRHQLGNRFLTFLTNMVTNLNLSDMETCYKAIRTDLMKSIPLESNDFRIEPELTIKLAKRNARIFEVPISYSGRTYEEGKKINWRDGFKALFAIAKFAFSDRIYPLDSFGTNILSRLSRAPKFNAWMADTIREFCGPRVLEIGSGVGNLTKRLIPREEYVASDINPLYVQALDALTSDRPYMKVCYCDVADANSMPSSEQGFDTVICLNVVEHIEDDKTALSNIRGTLARNGQAVILVPQGQWNFGTLDEVLGHQRRYTKASLQKVAEDAGFVVQDMIEFNRIGTPAWFFNGRVLRRRYFGLFQIRMLDLLTPIFRKIDRFLPIPGLSLIAVLRRADGVEVRARKPALPTLEPGMNRGLTGLR